MLILAGNYKGHSGKNRTTQSELIKLQTCARLAITNIFNDSVKLYIVVTDYFNFYAELIAKIPN